MNVPKGLFILWAVCLVGIVVGFGKMNDAFTMGGYHVWKIVGIVCSVIKAKGIVENIDHKVSGLLAGIGGLIPVFITVTFSISWVFFATVVSEGCAFIGIRLAIYSIFLNLFRRLPISYLSTKTNNKSDNFLSKIPFWGQRGIGLLIFIAVFIIFNTCQLN